MSEEIVVKHCSPTLAGVKTGNIFSCPCNNNAELTNTVKRLNRIFVKKGLRILPLRISNGKALIYLYRPQRLLHDLNQNTASQLLTSYGYKPEVPERCVAKLIENLRKSDDFPHEIGFFLGYPPEDVIGFIENKAADCKYVGAWKVYGDVELAKREFSKYKRCTEIYCKQYANGKTIERLTVAEQYKNKSN